MKYLFFYFLFFTAKAYSQQGNTFSFSQLLQPVYLGIDKPFFKEDAYGLGYKTPGVVNQGNHYFYLSPNANLIISDGSETGTASISVGGPNPQVAYLFATNKYVYYGKNPFKKANENIERFNPVTKDRSSVYSSNIGVLSLNDKQVPGNTYPVSEFFVGSKKDKIFIRTSETSESDYKLVSHVYCINDNNPDKIYTVYENYTMTPDGDVFISTDAKIADYKNDVFFNGRAKPTGVYETSALVCNGPQPINDSFKVISYYIIIKKKGFFFI